MAEHRKSSVILGVDPGTRVTGYGLIACEGTSHHPIDFGCIRPPANLKLTDRYLIIFEGLEAIIEKHRPEVLVVETQYVDKNPQTAIKLGMARGIVLIAAKRKGIPVYEYTPSRAKRAVVGKGNASKYQVQRMVQTLLNLSSVPEPEDAADALALALCHAQGVHRRQALGIEI